MYSNILVPIDMAHRGNWRLALSKAWELAQRFDAHVHAMAVIPGNPLKGFYPDVAGPEIQNDAKRRLDKIVRASVPSHAQITTSIECGGVCPEIIQVAHAIPADLIVMASHDPEMKDYLLGSNSGHVAAHAPCSVLVVRPQDDAGSMVA